MQNIGRTIQVKSSQGCLGEPGSISLTSFLNLERAVRRGIFFTVFMPVNGANSASDNNNRSIYLTPYSTYGGMIYGGMNQVKV